MDRLLCTGWATKVSDSTRRRRRNQPQIHPCNYEPPVRDRFICRRLQTIYRILWFELLVTPVKGQLAGVHSLVHFPITLLPYGAFATPKHSSPISAWDGGQLTKKSGKYSRHAPRDISVFTLPISDRR